MNIFRRHFGLCWGGTQLPQHIHFKWQIAAVLAATAMLVFVRVDSLFAANMELAAKSASTEKSEAALVALLNGNVLVLDNVGVACETINVKLK